VTPDETAGVLAMLTAAFPNVDLEEPTIELWMSALGEVDHRDGQAAAGAVIRTEKFFPAVSTFFDAVAAETHGRRVREAAMRGLPRPTGRPVGQDRFRRAIEEVWDTLAERGTRKHWHGGPDPCPVCGGGPSRDGGRPRSGQIIDLQERLAERRRRRGLREAIPRPPPHCPDASPHGGAARPSCSCSRHR